MISAGAGNGGQRWRKPGSATLNRNEWAVAAYAAPICRPYWLIVHMMSMVLFKMSCFYPVDIHKIFNDIFCSSDHISLKQATASAAEVAFFAPLFYRGALEQGNSGPGDAQSRLVELELGHGGGEKRRKEVHVFTARLNPAVEAVQVRIASRSLTS